MKNPTYVVWRPAAFSIFVCAILLTGCAQLKQAQSYVNPGDSLQPSQNVRSENVQMEALELQSLVMDMADDYVADISEIAYLHLTPSAVTAQERILAQSFMRNSFGAAADIAVGPNPEAGLLDLLVLIALQKSVFERHWIPEVWNEERGRIPLERLRKTEANLWERAAVLLSDSQRLTLRRLIDRWIEENPDKIVVELTRFDEFADNRRASNSDDREEAAGLLKEVGQAVGAIDNALMFGERVLWYSGRLTYILGEQTELSAYRILAAPEIKNALNQFEELQQKFDRISDAFELMPELIESAQKGLLSDVRDEREATLSQFDSVLRDALDDALTNLAAQIGEQRQQAIDHFFTALADERVQMFEAFEGNEKLMVLLPELQKLVIDSTELARLTAETTASVDKITSRFDTSGSADGPDPLSPDSKPDSIADAVELVNATKATLQQVQLLLESPQFNTQTALARDLSNGFVDRVFWRIAALLGIIFAGILALRFIPRRSEQA